MSGPSTARTAAKKKDGVARRPETGPRRDAAVGLFASNLARTFSLVLVLGLLVSVVMLSISVGARDIGLGTIVEALRAYNPSIEAHVTIHELRIPRTVTGLVVAPALGLSGALIQAFTRNPLADPGILGVNAGAAFAVTLAVGLLGVTAPLGYVWCALAGAGAVTVVVYLLGTLGGGQATPAKVTLAGVAIGAVLSGVTTAIVLASRDTFDTMRFWGVGSLSGRGLDTALSFAPLIAVGIVLAACVARPLNALALGNELATSLGVKISKIRMTVILSVTLLAGTATAVTGPIAFVGLMVPHIVRWCVGPDQRWIFTFTVIVSPILLLGADIVGRILPPSGELRVGLVTALVGAPVLILLARRKSVSEL